MNSESELYSQLMFRYNEHKNWAEKKVKRNKPFGMALALLIPIFAAFLTLLLGEGKEKICFNWPCCASILSLIIAILSILQSTIKPNERFIFFSGVCIELEEWYFNFKIIYESTLKGKSETTQTDKGEKETENDKDPKDLDSRLIDFFKEQNEKLSEIGKKMASHTLPSEKN